MKNEEPLKELLINLKKKYPDIKKVEIDFEGSGDSFSDFYEHRIEFYDVVVGIKDIIEKEFIEEVSENVLWDIMNRTDANFNNEGSRGTICIDFENSSYYCDVQHYVMETVDGEGTSGEFNQNSLNEML